MGRTALVTGGASGIGQACAKFLIEEGLTVLTADISPDADIRLDVTDSAQVAEAAKEHQVDVLVNSAGIIGPNKAFTDIEDGEWATTFAVNVTGTFYLCRAFIPAMMAKGWGRVVNIASIAGKEGNPNLAAYSASKAAVLGLTKSLGKELATSGVLVNAVAPAVIETPMADATAPEIKDRLVSLIPMRRMGLAREVAELVGWLASERCSFSTGAVYDISGGRATY